MSNLERMPETLGRIRQQMSSLKQATGEVWKQFTTVPKKNLYSLMSEDIVDVSQKLNGLNKQSRQLEKLNEAKEKLAAEGPTLFNSQYSIDKKAKKLKTDGIDADKAPEEQFLIEIKKQLATDQLTKLRQQRPAQIEQKGAEIGTRYRSRAEKISQLSSVSANAKAFAQPKLELAKGLLKPGADLEAGLSEVQAMLHLNNGDPRTAALRQQSLSMAASGHAPSDVVAKQKSLAESGMNADQVLAQTPMALNGATPVEQRAVTVKGDNLDGDITKLFASWDTIRINLFAGQSDELRQLTQTATGWLNTLNTWITENPQMVNGLLGLALGITGLISGLGFLGGVIAPVLTGVNMLMAGAGLLGTVFSGAGGIMAGAFAAVGGPVIALIAIIAGIAIVVAQLWEPIKAFVGGVIEGFTAAMGPVGDAFAPFKAALGWITDLFKPIEFTQETLNGVGDVGKNVGAAIAGLLADLNEAFSQIGAGLSWVRKGIDWVFGWNKDDDKKSSNSDSAAPSPPLLGDSASPTGGALSLYQPAQTNASNSLTDNRATTVNLSFNATPETDKNQVMGWIKEAADQQEWNKTNDRLGQFGYGGMYS